MVAKFFTLDEFLARSLVRHFYFAGSLLALLVAAIGLIVGIAAATQSVALGFLAIVFFTTLAVTLFLAVRLGAEAILAILRMHHRFVGGDPKDPIPQ